MRLIVKDVSMDFKEKKALQKVSFEVQEGQLIGLIGPNGAGKSTLMSILATLQKPTSGEITLDGVNIVENPDKMKKVLGYMPQYIPYIPNLSAIEYLQYISALKGLDKKTSNTQIKELLTRLHLSDDSGRSLGEFSGGMRQRVGLIAALLGDPKVVIVDEPSAGLDPVERIAMRNILSEQAQSKIVILSTHIISDIEAVANQIVLLNGGQITFSGTAGKLIQESKSAVWEFKVSSINEVQVDSESISEMKQTDQGLLVRMVSDVRPRPDAVNVTPTLEDASLWALKGR